MKAKTNVGIGQGWHKQSMRHSNARRTGRAGGLYLLNGKNEVVWNRYEKNKFHKLNPDVKIQEIEDAEDIKRKSEKAFRKEVQKEIINDNWRDWGIDLEQKELLLKLFKKRFPNETNKDYIHEWAGRIKKGRAWDAGDYQTRKALKKIDPKKYKDFDKDDSEYREESTAKKYGWQSTPRFYGGDAYQSASASGSAGIRKYKGYTSFMDGSYIGYYTI